MEKYHDIQRYEVKNEDEEIEVADFVVVYEEPVEIVVQAVVGPLFRGGVEKWNWFPKDSDHSC